jgi:saccharopepsin
VSFLVADLMNSGVIDPQYPYIAFETDYQGGTSTCRIGGVDPSRYDPNIGLRMPWQPYTQYGGVEYIWSTPLQGYTVGGVPITLPDSPKFALDSGSSQFKGDPNIMNETLQLIAFSPPPLVDVVIDVGQWSTGDTGKITVPPSVYNVYIEAGPDKGKTLPQFNPLTGLDALVLVGSVLMDQFYTVFEYDVMGTKGNYTLFPVAMYLYQKVNGPTGLLTPPAGAPPLVLGPKPVSTTR